MLETRRRTLAKSLLWRFIGIFWTWMGAYVILLLLPEEQKTAIVIATLVTAWHHSTRMVMYYFYERIWCHVCWGKEADVPSSVNASISGKEKIAWTSGTLISLVVIFWLLLGITPAIKKNQKLMIQQRTEHSVQHRPFNNINNTLE